MCHNLQDSSRPLATVFTTPAWVPVAALTRALRPDIGSESRFLPTHLHSTPPLGVPSQYCYAIWHGKAKMMWLPYVEKFFGMFIRFDKIHERDGHTHTQRRTPHDDIGCACIASRGKKPVSRSLACTQTTTALCQYMYSSTDRENVFTRCTSSWDG